MRRRAAQLALLSCLTTAAVAAGACSRNTKSGSDGDKKSADCPKDGKQLGTQAKTAGLNIRNGHEADEDEHPATGMLFYSSNGGTLTAGPAGVPQLGKDTRSCSATLVCSNVVITAAHCFENAEHPEFYTFYRELKPGEAPAGANVVTAPGGGANGGLLGTLPKPPVAVLANPTKPAASSPADVSDADVLGAADLDDDSADDTPDGPPRGRRVKILSKQGKTGRKDIALLQLDRKLSGKPIGLATEALQDKGEDGPKAVIIGYGATETVNGKDRGAGTKKVGSMRFTGYMDTPDNESLDGLGKLYPLSGVETEAELTANACPGDSGGATLVDGKLYGVISRIMNFRDGKIQASPSCAEANITLFTVVPRQLDWLAKSMKELCDGGVDALEAAVEAGKGGDDAAKPTAATVDAVAGEAGKKDDATAADAGEDGCG